MELPLSARIEALLFYKSEPVTETELARLLSVSADEVTAALTELASARAECGVQLIWANGRAELATAPEMHETIETLRKNEVRGDLGKAALETLSIVLYAGPISRSYIDYIRGVNSTFILRRLMVRGLIERVQDSTRTRQFHYQPTLELLSHLGVRTTAELPDYEHIRGEIETFAETQETEHAA